MAGILDEFLLIFRPTVKGSGLQQLNKQVKQTHSSLFGMKNLLQGFIGYDIYSGIKQFGSQLIQSAKDLGAMEARFYAITKSEKLAGEELEWVFNLAQRTATPLKATADSYSIFYAAVAKSIGQGGARQIFQDWTEVSRVLHLSEHQFERVTYALREMASKGAIYSQDLRMQIGTHVPNAMGLAEKAANELGYTGTEWFENFQKGAKGNQKLINQWLMLFSKFAKQQFASADALAEAMKKPDSVLQGLVNTWQLLQFGIVKAGFDKDLVAVIGTLNSHLSKIAFHAKEIYDIIKLVIEMVLLLSGIKFLAKLGKGLALLNVKFFSWFKSVKTFKDLTLFLRACGGGLAKVGNFLRIIGIIFRKHGLHLILKMIGGKLLARGILACIPYVGQIALAIWFAIDAIKLGWKLLKLIFPQITQSIELWASTIWGKIIKPFKDFWAWFEKHVLKKNGSSTPAPNAFPGVQPNPNSWDYIKKQNMFLMPSATSRALSGAGYGGTTISPIIYNTNNISANGLSEGQVADMINEANAKNNRAITQGIKNGIKNSKNTYNN